jgi:hypothetical protein
MPMPGHTESCSSTLREELLIDTVNPWNGHEFRKSQSDYRQTRKNMKNNVNG